MLFATCLLRPANTQQTSAPRASRSPDKSSARMCHPIVLQHLDGNTHSFCDCFCSRQNHCACSRPLGLDGTKQELQKDAQTFLASRNEVELALVCSPAEKPQWCHHVQATQKLACRQSAICLYRSRYHEIGGSWHWHRSTRQGCEAPKYPS